MKWISLALLILATLVLFGPRFDIAVPAGEHASRGYFASAPAFWALLLLAAISGGVALLRRP